MDKDTLLKALAGTLDANFSTRKQSEQQLHVFEEQPGFTAYLLDLITESNVAFSVQIAAAIFFKNRIVNYWLLPENKAPSPLYIQDHEKGLIKEKLVQTLIKTYKNSQIKLQLCTALHNILSSEKWAELVVVIKTLLSDSANVDHVYTGLLCLFEYTKNYRWLGLELGANPVLEEIATEVFPLLEALTNGLVTADTEVSHEMLYLVIKTFKFTTYLSLPSYFQDQAHLGNWCHLQILIINRPLPPSVLNDDSLENRASNPAVKTVKWCFGNLHRLLSRHGGGFTTKDKDTQFLKLFLENFVPQILGAYWTIIENWSAKKVWLSEGSLYHMISFLEQLVETPAWALISDKLEAIIKHVLLPTLQASEQTIELYEDEPEEYIRRFFDINRESNTADVASVNFVYRLSTKKFKSTINLILAIISDIFTRRAANRDDLAVAMEAEGAFRILSTVSYKLDKKASPVHGQIDQLLHTFVYPELSADTLSKTPFLTARACDTLAMFVYKYKDTQVLQDIFQGVVHCFQQQEQFPVQLTAVDALRSLVDEDLVAEHISAQAPQLMGTLLDMSKKIESDILTSVMDSFVERFATNLEPYAQELAQRLVEQFVKLASELLEQSSTDHNNLDVEKEYQAAGILNTLTTLVVSMNSSPAVAASLEPILKDMIKFVLENSMVLFLSESIEILESVLFATSVVSPILWELFQCCIDSFDTYALEYFDTFQPFFESVITKGFSKDDVTIDSPSVQALLNVCFNVLRSEAMDPIFAHSGFELIELTILALNQRFIPFLPRFLPEIFDVFTQLESIEAFDGYMLHHLSILKIFFGSLYIDPTTTLQFLNEKQFTTGFFKLWLKHSDDFQSVYGCKLQILASLAILCDANLSLIESDLVGEVVDLLISNLEQLPHAIRARQEILNHEDGTKAGTEVNDNDNDDDEEDEYGDAFYDDEHFEADDAELEALKETPIDDINVFEVFTNKLTMLQQQDAQKYQAVFSSLDQHQQETAQRVIQITHNAQSK